MALNKQEALKLKRLEGQQKKNGAKIKVAERCVVCGR